jgi:hypothetical protein
LPPADSLVQPAVALVHLVIVVAEVALVLEDAVAHVARRHGVDVLRPGDELADEGAASQVLRELKEDEEREKDRQYVMVSRLAGKAR